MATKWERFLTLVYVAVAVVAVVFTTTVGGLLLLIGAATIVLYAIYYAGVRVDRRLRGGPPETIEVERSRER